jgi:hypothetical protein
MTTLTIKDLAVTEELNAQALAAVGGGTAAGVPAYWIALYGGPTDVSIGANQALGQTQNVLNNNGNNVAFASCITSNVNPSQTGSNNIHL